MIPEIKSIRKLRVSCYCNSPCNALAFELMNSKCLLPVLIAGENGNLDSASKNQCSMMEPSVKVAKEGTKAMTPLFYGKQKYCDTVSFVIQSKEVSSLRTCTKLGAAIERSSVICIAAVRSMSSQRASSPFLFHAVPVVHWFSIDLIHALLQMG